MKRSSLFGTVTFLVVCTSVVCNSRNAAARAATPATPNAAAAPAANLTSAQSAALKLASDNLLRGYEDLKSTPPDTKGDTSRLEGHITEAINLLHQVDPAHVPAAPATIPIQDKGHTRAFILSAVKGHLDKARNVIEGAKVNNPNVAQALANIAKAEQELAAAGAAPAAK